MASDKNNRPVPCRPTGVFIYLTPSANFFEEDVSPFLPRLSKYSSGAVNIYQYHRKRSCRHPRKAAKWVETLSDTTVVSTSSLTFLSVVVFDKYDPSLN
jgi:hypothetical protein